VYPFLSFTVPPACEDNGIASKDTFHHELRRLSGKFPAENCWSCHDISNKPAGFAFFSEDIPWADHNAWQVFRDNLCNQGLNGWTRQEHVESLRDRPRIS
jgi:hypothetical protein